MLKLSNYKVVETFLSINGEGTKAGQLAFFIRFAGCNLACDYCDTKWANAPDVAYTNMDAEKIYALVKNSGSRNVTITGGEPLLQKNIGELLALLCRDPMLYVEVETNGSIPLEPFLSIPERPSFTMDYKLSRSGMEDKMCHQNLPLLTKKDTVKFVCGCREDLDRAREITKTHHLTERTNVYLSPVFGEIQPADMVEYMKEYNLVGVTLQLQMHKVIWDPNERGV